MSRAAQMGALALFTVLLSLACALLWHAHRWPLPALLGGTLLVVAGLWLIGRLGEGRAAADAALA